MLVSVSGVVGWATGPPQRFASARVPTLKTYTTMRKTVGRSGITRPSAGRRRPRFDLSARSAGSGTAQGWTAGDWERVTFSASPGDFPRGRPALIFLYLLSHAPAAVSSPMPPGFSRVGWRTWSRI
ncbi:hypothetical protein KRMM14A1004_40930 [Krasilnikovia sp. MM14-A1004]